MRRLAGFDRRIPLAALTGAVAALAPAAALVVHVVVGAHVDGAVAMAAAAAAAASAAAAATATSAFLAWVVLGRPLAELSRAARALGAGAPTGGPVASATARLRTRDQRDMAAALTQIEQRLSLAERQACALAAGSPEDPALDERLPGRLGAALGDAARTLAETVTEGELLRAQMSHEATHDGLTQLPNRTACLGLLQRGLARAGRSGSELAVLFIDLDRFKGVNDHHGHAAGDRVLRTAAARLLEAVRAGDHVGRLGGDEFVIVAEPIDGEPEAVGLAERLLEVLERPIEVGHTSVTVGASIGVALSGSGTLAAGQLLGDADLAMYEAKALPDRGVVVCDAALRDRMTERFDQERELRDAVAGGQLELHYQPIVRARSGGLCSFEALVRWDRPGHGHVGPDRFLPFAQRSDLVVHLDRWVLDTAVSQLATWDRQGRHHDVPVAINVSSRYLSTTGFPGEVISTLARHGVDASRLVIEITEHAVLDDLEAVAVALAELRSHGVRTAIDDFGTGYTSLAHLRALPVDVLKIDRSFVSDPAAHTLVRLIVETGHLLGAAVVAEGIETGVDAARLTELGCDELQGFLFGRARPASCWDDTASSVGAVAVTGAGADAPAPIGA